MTDQSRTGWIAAVILGIAIVWAAYYYTEARFTFQPVGELVYRLDTHTGEVWACTHVGCWPVPIKTKTLEQLASDARNEAAATESTNANQLELLQQQAARDANNSN